ncbi:recombinase family protein [Clostridium tunisiense]|uniref:recombinase family protein n=1 Tax=Clostridium tunisiense TaxID=219748 RepID=UPI0002EF5D72|nr:recombinase family protein [Clostridium tunisiense]
MKAAIYARKSKLTEKGDSIENQIKLCKDYLSHMSIEEIFIYKDEGFSGKNTDRPGFTQMIEDAKKQKFNILVCYKLDRISRNVADFSALTKDLETLSISFISVNEQFDTSSAMGRAMMYIASVFSQLERETISSRVRDNMYALAEAGKWLGGTPPTGYNTERLKLKDATGKDRSFCILVPIPVELELVKLIYDKYLEVKSMSKVEKYLICNDIKTKNNKNWSLASINSVLTAPVYVKADNKVTQYLKSIGIKVNGKPDGIHGILTYKKRKGKSGSNRVKDTCQWIASVSFHEGIISADKWIKVQEIITLNKDKAPALGSSGEALLSGIIKCSNCDSPMRVAYGKQYATSGRKKYYYMCTLKCKSRKTKCANSNINGADLDALILEELKKLTLDKSTLIEELKKYKHELEAATENLVIKKLNISIDKNEEMVDNLLNNLSLTKDIETATILLNKISHLKTENKALRNKINKLEFQSTPEENALNNLEEIQNTFMDLSTFSSFASVSEKRKLLSSIIHKVYANGDTGKVLIKFKGVEPQ